MESYVVDRLAHALVLLAHLVLAVELSERTG